jgi:hypothetical protein
MHVQSADGYEALEEILGVLGGVAGGLVRRQPGECDLELTKGPEVVAAIRRAEFEKCRPVEIVFWPAQYGNPILMSDAQ